jgi:hypothetical protein
MRKIFFLFCAILLASNSFAQIDASLKREINAVLNQWHEAAATADSTVYFSFMTNDAVFIGTASEENWSVDSFKTFCSPYFKKGKAWNFTCKQRNMYSNREQTVVWFDELLSTQMKLCRGSGVLQNIHGEWKIAHYVLSMTVPNDLTKQVVELKASADDTMLKKLENEITSNPQRK